MRRSLRNNASTITAEKNYAFTQKPNQVNNELLVKTKKSSKSEQIDLDTENTVTVGTIAKEAKWNYILNLFCFSFFHSIAFISIFTLLLIGYYVFFLIYSSCQMIQFPALLYCRLKKAKILFWLCSLLLVNFATLILGFTHSMIGRIDSKIEVL